MPRRCSTKASPGAFISPRYEQLCTARGTVRVGDDEWSFTGTGLRIHRQGLRDVGGFWGHCWPSALFPSGRGFGGLAFPERPDGGPTYNEAYVFDGERMIPAILVDAPWLRRLQPNGEDVAVTLRTEDGDVRIEGETIVSSMHARRDASRVRARAPAGGRAVPLGRRGVVRDDTASPSTQAVSAGQVSPAGRECGKKTQPAGLRDAVAEPAEH